MGIGAKLSLAVMMGLLAACGGRPATPIDASGRDVRRRDRADEAVAIDGLVADRHRDRRAPDTHHCTAVMGYPCTAQADCCWTIDGPLVCQLLATGARICTVECLQDDPSTPLVYEDTCPEPPIHACARAGPQGGGSCVRRCGPSAPCPRGLVCDPESADYTDGKLACLFD